MDIKLNSYVAEAFNTVRTNMEFLKVDRDLKIIMIVSSIKSEGKTTITANLANTLTANNKKVLIIDADLRNPSILKNNPSIYGMLLPTNRQGLSDLNRQGLSDLICENLESNAIQQYDCIIHYNKSIDILTAGHKSPNPLELLGSSRMKSILNNLREKYDIILIDTPPLLLIPDALALSKYVDGVILVVRYALTTKDILNNVNKMLNLANIKPVACIFNAVEGTKKKYLYYGYEDYISTKPSEKNKSYPKGQIQARSVGKHAKSNNPFDNIAKTEQAKSSGVQFKDVAVEADSNQIRQVIQEQCKGILTTISVPVIKLTKSSDETAKTTDFHADFAPGQDGMEVDLDTLVSDIAGELKQGSNKTVIAKEIESAAGAAGEDLSANFKLRGSYSTKISYPNLPSAYNMWKASDMTNTTMIAPGDTWSLKKAIGELNESNGWQTAKELVGEDQIDFLGGGINQFASTVYAAALTSELNITKCEHRAWPADYIPAGMDADIATDDNDLQITKYLIVQCDVPNGKLTAEFYSSGFSDEYTRQIITEVTATKAAGDPQTVVNTALPPGTTNIKRVKHDGSTVQVSLALQNSSGATVQTKDIGTVEYPAYNEIIEKNSAALAATPVV